MRVLLSSNSGRIARHLAVAYPDLIGQLISPTDWRVPFAPYALDNGAYGAHRRGGSWNQPAFLGLCADAAFHEIKPEWLLVPDKVGDRAETLECWRRWERRLRAYGWPLAFAVQDGMTVDDVPEGADLIFVGGSTAWKRETLRAWCGSFPRVHVGRINGYRWLWECAAAGAESCDGTGWFRGDEQQLAWLTLWLAEWAAGYRDTPREGRRPSVPEPHPDLFEEASI